MVDRRKQRDSRKKSPVGAKENVGSMCCDEWGGSWDEWKENLWRKERGVENSQINTNEGTGNAWKNRDRAGEEHFSREKVKVNNRDEGTDLGGPRNRRKGK